MFIALLLLVLQLVQATDHHEPEKDEPHTIPGTYKEWFDKAHKEYISLAIVQSSSHIAISSGFETITLPISRLKEVAHNQANSDTKLRIPMTTFQADTLLILEPSLILIDMYPVTGAARKLKIGKIYQQTMRRVDPNKIMPDYVQPSSSLESQARMCSIITGIYPRHAYRPSLVPKYISTDLRRVLAQHVEAFMTLEEPVNMHSSKKNTNAERARERNAMFLSGEACTM
jgi:hypothetical protein